jgi:hypothetical protein
MVNIFLNNFKRKPKQCDICGEDIYDFGYQRSDVQKNIYYCNTCFDKYLELYDENKEIKAIDEQIDKLDDKKLRIALRIIKQLKKQNGR